jgi:hypothetical protein
MGTADTCDGRRSCRPHVVSGGMANLPCCAIKVGHHPLLGTGSVSCNSVFVLYLCRFLNQEELMKRETMVQNP